MEDLMFRLGIGLLIYGISALSIYWLLHIKSIYDTVYKTYCEYGFNSYWTFEKHLNMVIFCPVGNTADVILCLLKLLFGLFNKKK